MDGSASPVELVRAYLAECRAIGVEKLPLDQLEHAVVLDSVALTVALAQLELSGAVEVIGSTPDVPGFCTPALSSRLTEAARPRLQLAMSHWAGSFGIANRTAVRSNGCFLV